MRGKHDRIRERGLRCRRTEAEHRLWQCLRDRRVLGFKFRRQHPLGYCIVDFVCLERRLILELDGSQHLQGDHMRRDARRTAFLERMGYRVIRFGNDLVLRDIDAVMDEIVRVLEASTIRGGQLGGSAV